jgi:putative Holliday junction resolvase
MMEYKESKYKDKFIIGVDFGDVTTGLALGKNNVVSPIRSIEAKDKMFAVQQIARAAKEQKAAAIVMGLPLSIDGKPTKKSLEVRGFAKLLQTRLGIPVIFVDEFGSTEEAQEEAIGEGLPRRDRKKVDSISASIILKRFFNNEGL